MMEEEESEHEEEAVKSQALKRQKRAVKAAIPRQLRAVKAMSPGSRGK